MKRQLELFWELFKISLLVIGGGYAIIAAAEATFSRKGWTEDGELVERLPVFQMIPGLIAAHTAVYVGNKVAGFRGAVIGLTAIALPSVVIFTLVSVFYRQLPLINEWVTAAFVGLRASMTGIIAATIVRSWQKAEKDCFFFGLLTVGLAAVGVFEVSIPLVLAGCMGLGLMREFGGGRDQAGTRRFNASWLPLVLFLKYGALGFGGGFVLVPMYLQDFVGPTAAYLQLEETEFANVMALSQMTPGPVGINCATFFGYNLAGCPGALVASLALLLPGAVLAMLAFRSLARFQDSRVVKGLFAGIRPASIALMSVALVAFARCSFSEWLAWPLAVATGYLAYSRRLGVVTIILLSALVAVLGHLVFP